MSEPFAGLAIADTLVRVPGFATLEAATCVLTLASMFVVPSVLAEPRFEPSASLRLRAELEDFVDDDRVRARMRLRARLGGSYQLEHGFEVAGRLSTGSDDPTSSQITLGDSFAKQAMRLDEAFVGYRHADSVALWLGKAPLPFENWRLILDRDVRGEGFSQKVRATLSEQTALLLAAGQYSLVATDAVSDMAYLFGGQAGVQVTLGAADIAAYISYYDFVGVNQIQLPFARDTNTRTPAGLLRDDYDLLNALLAVAYGNDEFSTRAHFEVVRNTEADTDEDAWTAGAQLASTGSLLGSEELALSYDYRYVESNAILDALAESSWHRQRTDAKGHRVGLSYRIADWNVSGSYKWMNTVAGPADRQREWLTDLRWEL